MKKIIHISICNRSGYSCMHMRNYVQTNRFANNRTRDRNNAEWRRKILPLCYARYAKRLVVSHLFPKLLQISHLQFSVAVTQEGRGIDLEACMYVRGRVHLFTNAQPRIPISKGYILDRQPPVLAQDNRDKWPVIRRSLKRGHSYELPEPAVSKIDFQLQGFGIPFRLPRHLLQSLDSLWTQRGRR